MSDGYGIARARAAAGRQRFTSCTEAGAWRSTSRVILLALVSTAYAPISFAPRAFAGELEQNVVSIDEYRIKAAYLYGLTKFILWPNEHAWQDSSPLDICIYGHNPFSRHLEALGSLVSRNHPIVVRAIEPWRSAIGCRILFIGAGNVPPPQLASGELTAAGVLTVGESEEFLRGGGLVSLLTEDDGVRIALNYTDAKRAGFVIDGGLLDIAKKLE
jgi:hypothetical protein